MSRSPVQKPTWAPAMKPQSAGSAVCRLFVVLVVTPAPISVVNLAIRDDLHAQAFLLLKTRPLRKSWVNFSVSTTRGRSREMTPVDPSPKGDGDSVVWN